MPPRKDSGVRMYVEGPDPVTYGLSREKQRERYRQDAADVREGWVEWDPPRRPFPPSVDYARDVKRAAESEGMASALGRALSRRSPRRTRSRSTRR